MRIILFRHGPASRRDPTRWPDDGDRPLTALGARLARNAAEGLAHIEPGIEQILSSPLVRTRQTARVLASVLGMEDIEEMEALCPESPIANILHYLLARVSDRDVILVGHEPGLGALAGALLPGSPAGLSLKKAGACSIRFEGAPCEGGGRLRWLLPPGILRSLATGGRRT
jgi:phosphohistidine phosphatase